MLKTEDYENMLRIMSRVAYQGLDEAKAAVLLEARIRKELQLIANDASKQSEVKNED